MLSDPQRRQLYDTKGKEAATTDMPQVDPSLFFTVLFGSNKFEPYVGKLRMATARRLHEVLRAANGGWVSAGGPMGSYGGSRGE